MIPKAASASDEDGFSILEMVVAMTILALVLGIASQSIVVASRSIAAARAEVEAARTMRAVLADFEANAGTNAAGELTQSGWRLKARTIEVSKAKLAAIVIAKTSGATPGGPFLTFVPVKDAGPK
ncbi:type II secretion system protein J [Mesorhizobium sp. IMUNJ 23033]|uniref:PulJ/GspJ family protein n=1 Tax=Mesorhizobium sp. IMUNJ 23033 TaxID=3378039 RepID=UPI00384F708F